MIKYFCDRCGKEESKGEIRTIQRFAYDGLGNKIVWMRNDHLCKECDEKFMAIHDKLKNEEDIFDMTDEDIELLRYTFNVGDKVIASDGRTGTIVEICTCDRCKKRGFYEPKVQMDIGVAQIWITDTDKENGFRSFYQIGNRVFGNIDNEASEYILQRIEELEYELTEYEEQLEVVRELKENNNGN